MPTSRDATFDAKLNNNFAEMITSLKKREGRASSRQDENRFPVLTTDGFARSKSVGHDPATQHLQIVTKSKVEQRSEDYIGRDTLNHLSMPASFAGSNNPAETPRQMICQNKSDQTRVRPEAMTSSSRISSLGPWTCRTCTFENLRNITKKARCEMCDTVRPIELGSDCRKAVKIVNIEC